MKFLPLIAMFFLFMGNSFAQTFQAEGRDYLLGTLTKSYTIAFATYDSLKLAFIDSTFEFMNPEKTVIKTVNKTFNYCTVTVCYKGHNGKDSLSRYYYKNELRSVYENAYDHLDREVYYKKREHKEDGTFEDFFWSCQYEDCLTGEGMISFQKNKSDTIATIYYDSKMREVKRVSVDGYPQLIEYAYDSDGKIISKKFDGVDVVNAIESPCDKKLQFSFASKEYEEIAALVDRTIKTEWSNFTSKNSDFFLRMEDADKQTSLFIYRRRPYWCEGRRAVFTTTEIFNCQQPTAL
jgi:hypothetical protein